METLPLMNHNLCLKFYPNEEKFDSQIFDEGIKQASENTPKDLKILFIYAGSYYRWYHRQRKIKNMFVPKMRQHGIRQAVLTLGEVFYSI